MLTTGIDNVAVLDRCSGLISEWFLRNGLMLNAEKTEAIVFGTAAKLRCDVSVPTTVSFSGSIIKTTDVVKILGVSLDANLNLNAFVSKTVSSCNFHIRALRHVRSSLTQQCANIIACSLVNARLDYCNSLLFGTSRTNVIRLQRVQNSLARVVLRLPWRSSVSEGISSLGWLRVEERIIYKIAVLTYNVIHTSQPFYLYSLITVNVPTRALRSSSRIYLVQPMFILKSALPAFTYCAPNIWNSLSDFVCAATSLEIFKKRLKTELFARGCLASN